MTRYKLSSVNSYYQKGGFTLVELAKSLRQSAIKVSSIGLPEAKGISDLLIKVDFFTEAETANTPNTSWSGCEMH